MNENISGYIQSVKRALPIIGALTLGAGLFAAAIATSWAPSFDTHFTYVVSLAEREQEEGYQFDGYYALQATEIFVASLAKWTAAPETVVKAYEKAGVPLTSPSVRSLSQAVKAEKTAPQIVQVTITGQDQDKVKQLAAGLRQVVAENLDKYHAEGVPMIKFKAIATEEWTGKQDVAAGAVGTAVAAITGFLLLNVVLIRESLQQMSVSAEE